MNVLVRPYVTSDSDQVTSIWFSSWHSTGIATSAPVTLGDLRERWPQELAKGWSVHVATVESAVVGFIALHENKIEQLFIAPDYQRHGIGKQLLDFAKAQMPNRFHLTTALQSQAGRFYEREGLKRGEITLHPRFGHQIVRYDWITGERQEVFFYGLFMDSDFLRQKGLHPTNERRASIANVKLRLGARATLVPNIGGHVYGVLMCLTDAEIEQLYAEPSVADYRPNHLVAALEDGGEVPALCFTLPETTDTLPPSADYAVKLKATARRAGLPQEYIDIIGAACGFVDLKG